MQEAERSISLTLPIINLHHHTLMIPAQPLFVNSLCHPTLTWIIIVPYPPLWMPSLLPLLTTNFCHDDNIHSLIRTVAMASRFQFFHPWSQPDLPPCELEWSQFADYKPTRKWFLLWINYQVNYKMIQTIDQVIYLVIQETNWAICQMAQISHGVACWADSSDLPSDLARMVAQTVEPNQPKQSCPTKYCTKSSKSTFNYFLH